MLFNARHIFFIVVASLLLSSTAQAWVYLRFEQITVAGTAIGLTGANINAQADHPAAIQASCRLRGAQVSYTIDGTTPTASVGTLLEVGDVLVMNDNDVLNRFLAIRTTGVSGQLDCTESR